MKRILVGLCLIAAALSAQSASLDDYVGKPPLRLLKMADFANAYRAAIRDVDLPAWTKRLAAGQAAEIVEIGGSKRLLTSACGKIGCLDERIYILFDAQAKTASGFFFLPPGNDPDDSRAAFSQWLGKPGKQEADFLLERAINDARRLVENRSAHE